jgi:hypothetical protein
VPVEFLSDEEASAYGAYRGAPSQSDLESAVPARRLTELAR